jgi:ribulose-phosphate 3-epimerase
MPVLIPSILTRDAQDFHEKLSFLENVPEVNEVQIDFADGKFVDNQTLNPKQLGFFTTRLQLEAHLIVNYPQHYFHDLEALGFKRLILHHESFHDQEHLITALKNARHLGFSCGVALSPHTEVGVLDRLIDQIDMALLLGVYPGWQGQELLPETLDRISALRKRHPYVVIGVDGGVNLENFQSLIAHGADRLVVGSAMWITQDPKQVIREFLEKMKS